MSPSTSPCIALHIRAAPPLPSAFKVQRLSHRTEWILYLKMLLRFQTKVQTVPNCSILCFCDYCTTTVQSIVQDWHFGTHAGLKIALHPPHMRYHTRGASWQLFVICTVCFCRYRSDNPSGWDPCGSKYPTCSQQNPSNPNDPFEGKCEFHEVMLALYRHDNTSQQPHQLASPAPLACAQTYFALWFQRTHRGPQDCIASAQFAPHASNTCVPYSA